MQKRNRIILIILLIAGTALAVGMLRELGYVNLSRYNFEAQSNTSRETATVHYLDPLAIPSPGVVVTSTSDSSFARAVKTELERQVKNKPGVHLAISLNQIDVEGSYWLPLVKRAHCVFQLQVRVADGTNVRDSTISSEMELTVKGVCSILRFKQLLVEQVVQETIKYIEQ